MILMSEFERFLGKEFFIIDSNNLQSVNQDFYGYGMQNDEIVLRENINNDLELNGFGAYVWVKVDSENITISQDYVGSYGVYVYQFNDEFVVSNSFVKLVDYLKNSKHITFNKKFADSFMFSNLVPYGYDKTLVNEIRLLPRDYKVIINKMKKSISFEQIDLEEQTVNLDSYEGMALLDGWYERWVNIIRSLKLKTNDIMANLSGGFDSRIVAALWLSADINLDEITVNSYRSRPDDLEVASEIAERFNFKLNENTIMQNPINFKELDTILNISFYTKLGFNKEFYFKFNRFLKPVYVFGGAGGGIVRGFFKITPEEFIDSTVDKTKRLSNELAPAAEEMLRYLFEKIKEKYDDYDEDSYELVTKAYVENRNRHHFGKTSVESFCSNRITLSPLNDNDLHKLIIKTEGCDDSDLLMVLIFLRYCPELLEIDFLGDREIDENIMYYAKKINEKYPYTVQPKKTISCNNSEPQTVISRSESIDIDEPNKFFEEVFCSRSFEMEFKKYYSNEIYQAILDNFLKSRGLFPMTHVFSAVSILKIINDTKYKEINKEGDTVEWIKTFLNQEEINEPLSKVSELLRKYVTARIDMKNIGSEYNTLEVVENDNINSIVSFPKWMSNERGSGFTLRSYKGSLNLKVKCIRKGLLKIWLRGLDLRDKNGKRFPVYIDYVNFSVNNDFQFNRKLTSHDKPFIYKKEVNDGEIVDIHIEWMPFSNLSEYEN
jgi:hypothetical protein